MENQENLHDIINKELLSMNVIELEDQLLKIQTIFRDRYIELNGKVKDYHNRENCDANCNGWNGKNRRCACGNRRIEWTNGFYYEAY